MLPLRNSPTLAYALSGLLGVLLPVSAVAGLLYGSSGLYASYPADLAGSVDPFQAFLFVLFALMMAGALALLVPYMHSIMAGKGTKGQRADAH